MKNIFLITFFFSMQACRSSDNFNLPGVTTASEIQKKIVYDPIQKKARWSAIEKLNDASFYPYRKFDKLKVLQNNESVRYFKSIVSNANQFLLMNFLSINCDKSTESWIKSVESKAKSGVLVVLAVNKYFKYLDLQCLKRLEFSGVQILDAKTHASYIVNDQYEVLIGSQNVARMFFEADGFNNLDRDIMAYLKGSLSLDLAHHFLSSNSEMKSQDAEKLIQFLNLNVELSNTTLIHEEKKDREQSWCKLVSLNPKLGIDEFHQVWENLIDSSEREIIFSGVKVDIDRFDLGNKLKNKSNKFVTVKYLGNGYLGGNGELTMVLNEWIQNLKVSGWGPISALVEKIRDWDLQRNAFERKKEYDILLNESKIQIYNYFNFIHYKVWFFDKTYFLIGSPNLDVVKHGKLEEAGILCRDPIEGDGLISNLTRDEKNSVEYHRE